MDVSQFLIPTGTVYRRGQGESLGKFAIDWMEFFLIHGEGDRLGMRFETMPWFREFLMGWYVLDDTAANRVWFHDEGLVGLSSGASKTESFAALAVFEMNAARGWDGLPAPFLRKTPIITMLAASYDQAGELFRQAQIMAGGEKSAPQFESPLRGRFDVQATVIKYADGEPGRIQRVAAEAATAEGGKETLLLGDELHEHTGAKARVWTVRQKSMTKRKDNPGRAVGMSTAGRGKGAMPPEDDDPLLWRLFARMTLEREDPDARSLLQWVGVNEAFIHMRPRSRDDEERREIIRAVLQKMAGADVSWDVETRLQETMSGKIPWFEMVRYYGNAYVGAGAESWLANIVGAWEECEAPTAVEELPSEGLVCFGVDMSLHHDSSAITAAWVRPGGKVGWKEWHFPPVNGRVDHVRMFNLIKDELVEQVEDAVVVYDPRFFELPARLLEDENIEVVEFRQSIDRLVSADGLLYELLVGRLLEHSGTPILNQHAQNGVFREGDGGRYLSKGRSTGNIDIVRAGSMATHELMMRAFDGEDFQLMVVDYDET